MACRILVPQPGIQPGPLAGKAQSPNHWMAGNSLYLCKTLVINLLLSSPESMSIGQGLQYIHLV